jgi:hypothetical protein
VKVTPMKTLLIPAAAALVALQAPAVAQKSLSDIKTRPERTEYRETSRYEDVVAFMNDVAQAAPTKIRLTSFGKTVEGRTLPLAVVGAPAGARESSACSSRGISMGARSRARNPPRSSCASWPKAGTPTGSSRWCC